MMRPTSGSMHSTPHVNVSQTLKDATHVILRQDGYMGSLQVPYEGPYEVQEKGEKTFTIEIPGRVRETVSIDRLKPAFLDALDPPPQGRPQKNAPNEAAAAPPQAATAPPPAATAPPLAAVAPPPAPVPPTCVQLDRAARHRHTLKEMFMSEDEEPLY